jgi:hypothetical protein
VNAPEVVRNGALSMQVCVPKQFTDEQVEEFANSANPSGTQNGWRIRRQGDEALAGCDERVQCAERGDCCHVMLDC